MRGRAITGEEETMLMHVVSVLLSMATLAERAAYLPFPVRWLSLWAIWRARHAAEAFLAGTGSEVLSRPHGSAPLRRGYLPDEAFGLAAALRLLAFSLRRHTERLARPWLTWKCETQSLLHRPHFGGGGSAGGAFLRPLRASRKPTIPIAMRV